MKTCNTEFVCLHQGIPSLLSSCYARVPTFVIALRAYCCLFVSRLVGPCSAMSSMQDFLKCLNLYAQEIISRGELINLANVGGATACMQPHLLCSPSAT